MQRKQCRVSSPATAAASLARRALAILSAVCAAAAATAGTATADEVAEHYAGKTLTIVVGHEAGTGYDVYARTLYRHLGRHVPGQPNVVVQNMPGASGMTAANWLYNIAPRDGLVIATFVTSTAFEAVMGNKAARFETAGFTWLGNLEESVGVCGVSKAAGIERFADLRTKEVIIGGTAASGPLTRAALAVRNLLGVRIKVVSGYQGSASVKVAIQRGEVHGICGLVLSTITSFWREEYESGSFFPIIQLAGRRHSILAQLPQLDDFATSEEDREVQALIFGTQVLGRLYAAPPGIPVDRRDALRRALMAAAADPLLLADAARTNIDISPRPGVEVEAFVARLSAASPAVVERARQAYAP